MRRVGSRQWGRRAVVLLALTAMIGIAVQCGERMERRAASGSGGGRGSGSGVGADGSPLAVETRLPEGEVATRATVTVVFDRPVARLGDADPSPATGRKWLVLEPPAEGVYHWVGTRTLTFTALRGLPAATPFSVRVPAGVRALDGAELPQDVEWRFTTPRPELVASLPAAGDSLTRPGDPIVLRFNIAVEPAAVAEAAALRGTRTTWRASRPDSALRAQLDTRFWDADDDVLVRLDPQPALERDRAYVLQLAPGLRGRGGPLGLATGVEIPFRTYGAPGLLQATPLEGGGVQLIFRTPVDADSARARLVFHPPVEVRNVWQDGARIYVWAAFGYQQEITVTAPADLVDVFGQRLGAPQSLTFTSAPREPSLQLLPREAVLLPGTSRTVALVASGMGPVRVRAARVSTRDEIRARNEPLATPRWTLDRRFPAPADANRLVNESIDLATLLPKSRLGAVVVEAQATPLRGGEQPWQARAVLRWSDLGVATKVSAENGLVWTTHMSTAAAWPNVDLRLVDPAGAELWRGKSDRRGIAELPGLRTLARDPWQVSLVAVSGADTATSSLQGDWRLDPWRFDIPGTYGTPPVAERAYLWGDRDVFRPGDTVHLAGLLRRFVASGLAPNALDSITVSVRDPVGRAFVERRVAIDARGTFSQDFVLPPDAMIGRYRVEAQALLTRTTDDARAGSRTAPRGAGAPGARPTISRPTLVRHAIGQFGFEIAAYRAPSFRVVVTPAARNLIAAQRIEARVEGSYYFGAPLAGATFQWQATRQRQAFAPRGFEEYSFDDPELDLAHGGQLASGRGALADSGVAQIGFDLPPELPAVTHAVVVEASVRDAAGDVVAGHGGILLHPLPAYAGVQAAQDFVRAGEPMTVRVVAVRADTAATAPGTPISVELVRREWRAVRKLLVGGRIGYETAQLDSVIETRNVMSGAEPLELRFTPQEPGSYRVRARVTTATGTGPVAVASFWASGTRPGAFPPTDAVRIELASDRRAYKVGDVARILLTTPVRNRRVLVTLEREGLIESRIVDLDDAEQVIDVEIKPEYLPNVYVGVAAVEPALAAADAPSLPETARLPRYVAGYVPLRVDVSERRLAVEVKPERAAYAPGDRARVAIVVRDAAGAPAAGHVAVAVVDEAVLALLGTPLPDPFAFFYGERALGVATTDTRLRLSAGSRLESAAFKADAGGDGAEKLAARSLFTTTAYWNPRVEVGADGRAQIDFTLPDNLTSFRVIAVAASGVDRFGSGRSSLRVAKPLTVDSALPRFAQVGDTLEVAGVVTSLLPKRRRVEVRVTTGLELLADAGTRFDLAPGASRRVAFRARAVQAGTPEVRFEVRAGDASDALVRTLPVIEATVPRTAATARRYERRADRVFAHESIAIPAHAVAAPQLEVTLAASALAGNPQAFAAVSEYPYGCLEQRASRLLVLLLQRKFSVSGAGGAPPADSTLLQSRARITATVTALEEMMSQWGGFTFWDGGEQAPDWMQAYALLALARARREGFEVSRPVIDSAAWRVVRLVREGPASAMGRGRDHDPRVAPAAVTTPVDTTAATATWWQQSALGLGMYALSQLYPAIGDTTPVQVADVAVVTDNLQKLPEEERIFMALALRTWGRRPEIPANVARDVLRRAEVTAATASVSPPADNARARPFRTSNRATSLALWLASSAQPDAPLVPKLAAGLLMQRVRGHWQTTQDDALALLALDAYRDAAERTGGPVRVRASLGDAGPSIVALDAEAGALEQQRGRIELLPAVAPGGEATLTFAGQGVVHTAAILRWRENAADQQPIEAGYALVRRLERLQGRDALRVGDLVVVTLELVVPRESYYLALVDPLPAGLEIVQPHFQTETRRAAEAEAATDPGFAPLPVSHVERRDRELQVFADYVPAGVYAHRYVARVRAAGGFAHAPARVEAMYTPELQAATPPSRLRTRGSAARETRRSGSP